MSLDALPPEILQDILGRLLDGFVDLRNCSLVCKSLCNASATALYKDIDLAIDDRGGKEDRTKSVHRQIALLHSLALNPALGASVRLFGTFRYEWYEWKQLEDPISALDSVMANKVARNMYNICEASLTTNGISAHIIENLQLYPQLTDLYIRDQDPKVHVWTNCPVSLTRLRWDVPDADPHEPWASVQYLLCVAEATCPNLQHLEINYYHFYPRRGKIPQPSGRALLYHKGEDYSPPKLHHLRHFGVRFSEELDDEPQSIRERSLIEFLGLHRESLKSLFLYPESTEFLLTLCDLLPNLEDLSVGCSMFRDFSCSPYRLMAKLASPRFSIKRLNLQNIGSAFCPELGRLFRACEELEVLTVGDRDNNGGAYGNDGRPDFEAYCPNVLGFIQELPPSLKELYIEINGRELCVDEDADFVPMCDTGFEIFSSLPRLNTCDIHAWISNMDGGLGSFPEKAVCYRRMKHHRLNPEPPKYASYPGNRIKDVWATRMTCLYQSSLKIITKELEVCRLDEEEGVFEGEDATALWQEGYTFEYKERATGRGRDPRLPDFSWPFSQDKFARYPRFRKRLL